MIQYKILDMENYPRLEHFKYFSAMPIPTVGITAKVDVTKLVPFCKAHNCSFYMAVTHIACIAANKIPEFRRRTRDGGIIEYAACGTSHIELLPDKTYFYCTLWHDKDWDEFIPYANACREEAVSSASIQEDEDVDALYFVTTMPWVHYEQITMPVASKIPDNPSFCWGRYQEDHRGHLMMPFTVSANHALLDGIHLGAFFREFQAEADRL